MKIAKSLTIVTITSPLTTVYTSNNPLYVPQFGRIQSVATYSSLCVSCIQWTASPITQYLTYVTSLYYGLNIQFIVVFYRAYLLLYRILCNIWVTIWCNIWYKILRNILCKTLCNILCKTLI